MAAHSITLQLPETLYELFRRRAEWSHRSLETEILDAVASAASQPEEIPADLVETLGGLEALPDDELWRLARLPTPLEAREELEALHLKQRDQGLSDAEDAARARLIGDYERTMLVRAQASKVLKDRGHDVSGILATQ